MMKTTHNQDAQRPDAEALVAPGTIAPATLAVPAGSTWLPPVTLSPAEFDGHMPRVALDPQGGAFVVWLSRDPGSDGTDRVQAVFRPVEGSFGLMQPIFDASNGQPTPQVPYLQVARDTQGNKLVVWTRSFSTSTSDRVQAAFIPAGEVSAVADIISEDGQDAHDPQVAFGRGGDALIVWHRFDGTHQRIQAAHRPAGGSFGSPQTISDPGQDAFEPQLAFDRAGNTLAVWTRSDGANRRVQAAVRPTGGSFGPAQTLSEAGQPASAPQVAVDPQGHAIVIWDRSDGTNHHIQVAMRPPGGVFGRAQTISAAEGSAFKPRVGFDSQGGAIAIWQHSNGANVRVQATFRQPGSGRFDPPQTISAADISAVSPEVAIDGQGNAVAAWKSFDGTNFRIQAAVRRAGRQFELPETISEPGGIASEPQVAIDGQGNPIVVWQRFGGTNRRIQATFRAAAQTISEAGQAAGVPRLAVDPQGNATAIWEFSDGTNHRIQAAFRPLGGTFGPPQSLSAAGQDAARPQIAFDGQGTAIAIWERSDGTNDRLQAAFRPAGGSFGPAQTISAGDAAFKRLAVNTQGNALVVWDGFDGTNPRVQAAFRPTGGSFGPPQNISAALQGPVAPEVAIDQQGNALAIWTRSDGTNHRIQAAFRPVGGSFSPAQTISDPGQNAFSGKVAFDAQGNALAIWTRSDGTHLRIQAAFRPAGGSFGAPQTISPAGGSASQFTEISVDAQGNALVVWDRSDGTHLRIQAAFRPAGGSFGAPQTISPNGQNASSRKLVMFDGLGNALVVWGESGGTDGRIHAAFRPAGGSFGPPQSISDPGQNAFLSQLVVDAQGNALAVWERFDGTNPRVQVAFRPAGGSFGPP
jgi:hypothetical protein